MGAGGIAPDPSGYGLLSSLKFLVEARVSRLGGCCSLCPTAGYGLMSQSRSEMICNKCVTLCRQTYFIKCLSHNVYHLYVNGYMIAH